MVLKGVPCRQAEERANGTGEIFGLIMAKNAPKLMTDKKHRSRILREYKAYLSPVKIAMKHVLNWQ